MSQQYHFHPSKKSKVNIFDVIRKCYFTQNRFEGYYKRYVKYINKGLITLLKYFWIQK